MADIIDSVIVIHIHGYMIRLSESELDGINVINMGEMKIWSFDELLSYKTNG